MRRTALTTGCLGLVFIVVGCGHTASSQVGLMSFGDLEGKVIDPDSPGPMLTGKDCSKIGGDPYSLSEAVRDALNGTPYDTLVDVTVENTTGLFVGSNCIRVKGRAVEGRALDIRDEP